MMALPVGICPIIDRDPRDLSLASCAKWWKRSPGDAHLPAEREEERKPIVAVMGTIFAVLGMDGRRLRLRGVTSQHPAKMGVRLPENPPFAHSVI